MEDNLVIFERRGPAAVIRINREQKLNALNRPIFAALKRLLDQVAADEALHAAILTGTGRAFCAGADIGEYWRQDLAAFAEFQRLGRELHDRVEKHPKPIIAAVNGFAFGGGFELALACDLIVASERAQFGLPEPSLGLVPGGGGTQRLPRLIGRYRAKQVLLTGKKLTAQEAEEWGIVAAVAPAGEEVNVAETLVGNIARLAPQAVRMGKRLINEGVDASLETALSYEQQALLALYAAHDGQEGVAAFMEKRPPQFTGR